MVNTSRCCIGYGGGGGVHLSAGNTLQFQGQIQMGVQGVATPSFPIGVVQ